MAQINWDGLIITTIKLEPPNGKSVEDLVDGDKVVFNEMDGNEASNASFLKEIRQDMNESSRESYRVFTATYVSPPEAAKIANEGYGSGCTPLFFVHGFNNEPGYTLGTMMPRAKEHCMKEKIFYPIPVIWPVYGSSFGYKLPDQNKYTKKNSHVPLDGYHVVFNGACGKDLPVNPYGPPGPPPDVKFDNIFLVAAEVCSRLLVLIGRVDYKILFLIVSRTFCIDNTFAIIFFLENPSDGAWGFKREKAANMKAMLHEGGKIYVVHNNDDKALFASIALNFGRARIGAKGAYDVRPDMSDIVVNIDAKPFTDKDEDPDDDRLHSYHFEDWAVE
eukprot:CAMPEP_0116111502 /NCGR_PEP_ID=MMETSP0327-20121206/18481_1 /TAXON_ID=44447 /ORGANISM="Pseudo-nitzschia delicatissima, Strain B596" /LENGTH=332 /DNA_ID=CAMNT_0003604741 /DNA_START=440 /DNA_END=1437 /DNA_ORIENTATION=+